MRLLEELQWWHRRRRLAREWPAFEAELDARAIEWGSRASIQRLPDDYSELAQAQILQWVLTRVFGAGAPDPIEQSGVLQSLREELQRAEEEVHLAESRSRAERRRFLRSFGANREADRARRHLSWCRAETRRAIRQAQFDRRRRTRFTELCTALTAPRLALYRAYRCREKAVQLALLEAPAPGVAPAVHGAPDADMGGAACSA
jgi:hypothetical protein